MAWSQDELVQRGHFFAIVDEVDSILIDEARTPLIISGPGRAVGPLVPEFARIVARLQPGTDGEGDYEVDDGQAHGRGHRARRRPGSRTGWASTTCTSRVNTPLVGYLNNALKAKELYKRDKDYIVTDGEVLIVDEFTGRILLRPPVQRGHAPGDRGQGGRRDQAGEPDPRHDHPAELLPPLREARPA